MVRSLPPGGADRMAKSCRTISTPSTSCSERDNLPQRPAAYPAGLLLSNKSGAPHENDLRSRRSEEHTSELQSLMRISYAVFCLKKKKTKYTTKIKSTKDKNNNIKDYLHTIEYLRI